MKNFKSFITEETTPKIQKQLDEIERMLEAIHVRSSKTSPLSKMVKSEKGDISYLNDINKAVNKAIRDLGDLAMSLDKTDY